MLQGTWLIIALFVIGLENLPRSLAAQEIFREPRIDGVRVDWCLHWGGECGQPAADEFCRRQGFKTALSFDVTRGVGPTLILGSGKTCANCDGFFYVVCSQADQGPEQGRGALPGPAVLLEDGWRYEVLAQGKVIEPVSVPSRTGARLLDLKPIDVKGFRTARIFVHVMEFSPEREWKLTKEAKLRVEAFHTVQGGSYPYVEAEVPMKEPTYLSGWVEIPVVGPELRIVVWGDNLPKSKMFADCTMYLLD